MIAMERFRRPFFFAAVALIIVVVLVELGASFILRHVKVSREELESMVDKLGTDVVGAERDRLIEQMAKGSQSGKPPGIAIPSLVLLDGLVLYTVALMAAPFLFPERVLGRLQGILTLIVSLAVLVLAVLLFITIAALLTFMVTLLGSFPFGTLVYLVLFGFFNRPGASITLSLLMALKLAFAGCLVLAHQRFLQNKGLVLLVLTSLLGMVIVSFLQGLVPLLLVSITDALAALIVVVLAGFWAIFLLIGSIIGIRKALA
jgi:hypothetical protein